MENDRVEFLRRLLDISQAMAENPDLDLLLDYAMGAALELVNARKGHLILLAEDGTRTHRTSHGVPDEVSHSILERVLETKTPLLVKDALNHEEFGRMSSVRSLLLRSIMCVPLISEDRLLGAVYVENRSLPNVFNELHLDALIFFAKQAAVIIRQTTLTKHLQKAREELITTREEERRRIRRDLHDGLGPSLAALRLQLQAAQNQAEGNPQASIALLEDMKGEIDDILNSVRRIVYELRPPALDELGLTSAIQEYVRAWERNSDLQFQLSIPDKLPPLAAAVEVALYRITLEAITNVTRHAQAQNCFVRLNIGQMIQLEIQDDGQGFSETAQIGVGLSSIRERVEELGGTLDIIRENGVSIQVSLPFAPDRSMSI